MSSATVSPTVLNIGGQVETGLVDFTGGKQTVQFERPFQSPPTVMISLTGFDIDAGHNARIGVNVIDVTSTEFTLNFATWADTIVYSAHASWIAVGN